jgi:hypothetical protein
MDASLHFITFSMTNRDVILHYATLHCGMTPVFQNKHLALVILNEVKNP